MNAYFICSALYLFIINSYVKSSQDLLYGDELNVNKTFDGLKNEAKIMKRYDFSRSVDETEDTKGTGSNEPKYLFKAQGCKIQDYSPFSEDSLKYYAEAPVCTYKENFYYHPISVEDDVLKIDFDYFRYEGKNNASCCYKPYKRIKPTQLNLNLNLDLKGVLGIECKPLTNKETKIAEEYIETLCDFTGKYTMDMKQFVVPKRRDEVKPRRSSEGKPSVLLVGLRGVSRLNAFRHLKKTVALLQKKKFIDVVGLAANAEDSFESILPVLTGFDVDNLAKCSENGIVDKCNFIWNNYKAKEYQTAFLEDQSQGLFFSNNYSFRVPPTDYYSHPFIHDLEKCCTFKGCVTPDNQAFTTFNRWLPLKYHLVGAYDLIDKLTTENIPLFGFFWSSSVPWTEMNPPHNIDNLYHAFFDSLFESDVHLKSIIIFLSDKGADQGEFAKTEQGRYEKQLPFAFFYFPQWFRRKYTQAMINFEESASSHLITGYDLKATLTDLLDEPYLKLIERWAAPRDTSTKGISLFSSIPEGRTCKSAGLRDKFCPCI